MPARSSNRGCSTVSCSSSSPGTACSRRTSTVRMRRSAEVERGRRSRLMQRAPMRRIAAASAVGTTLEWYDFALYNAMAGLVFNKIFFPSFDPLAGTLLAFSTYAVGYIARPLGGIICGRLGDIIGRRPLLIATVSLMGATTTLIGLLPGYDAIGVLAPMVLVLLRLIQGVALGGEWAGAVLLSVEHGRSDRRGINASWSQCGTPAGTLLATGALALTTY